MEFIHEMNRPGMTVLAPDINDATGDAITEAAVVDTRIANLVTEEDREYLPEEIEEPQAEYVEEVSPEDLVSIHDEILSHEYQYSEDTALAIAQTDIGDNAASIVVKHLSAQYFLGNLTAEEAFSQAIESGLKEADLVYAFNKLKRAVQ